MSEIEDIFAGKKSATTATTVINGGEDKPKKDKSGQAKVNKGKKKASENQLAASVASSTVGKKGKIVMTASSREAVQSAKADPSNDSEKVSGKRGKEEKTASNANNAILSKKRKKAPEEIFDPSLGEGTSTKSKRPSAKAPKAYMDAITSSSSVPDSSTRGRNGLKRGRPYVAPTSGMDDSNAAFADSRGIIADSKRKRTEEGFLVYTEEELGINRPDAGETDLCPFDCDCCF
ncbi:DUF1764-domain-containing protein [Tilletiaria anomala UBC 951]|uniref:DUF1764-domain-containing protein n=1 Tax=Tilletiaria anomala (strain ATCC 24038 / CBS 436.72 / UBC 951) TaxID=1037660 RepID=A0A066WRF4_TILAU|nr:DUF1764-domain-containing protein [Tilletiaria anomala UBC 951]KDN53245.1 DUF1764-domain-containing protein [Tilletiaria anomala UBC 951]